ncbi:hypothetical protein GGI43DRAFT_427778 [Trichoderma evansii]
MDLLDDILQHARFHRLFAKSLSFVAFLIYNIFDDFDFDYFVASQYPRFYLFQYGLVVLSRLLLIFWLLYEIYHLFRQIMVLIFSLKYGHMSQSFQPTIKIMNKPAAVTSMRAQ